MAVLGKLTPTSDRATQSQVTLGDSEVNDFSNVVTWNKRIERAMTKYQKRPITLSQYTFF